MSELWIAVAAGAVAGLAASAAMNGYQGATAKLFGQGKSDDDPATVKAADDASETVAGHPVRHGRAAKGNLVHYATGLALGIGYAVLVWHWPPAAFGFGVAFGLAVALVLDDAIVPALGWGAWPWATPLKTHLYGLSAHVVFGLVLEAVRRLAVGLLA